MVRCRRLATIWASRPLSEPLKYIVAVEHRHRLVAVREREVDLEALFLRVTRGRLQ